MEAMDAMGAMDDMGQPIGLYKRYGLYGTLCMMWILCTLSDVIDVMAAMRRFGWYGRRGRHRRNIPNRVRSPTYARTRTFVSCRIIEATEREIRNSSLTEKTNFTNRYLDVPLRTPVR